MASDKRIIALGLVKNARRNAFVSVDGGKAQRISMSDLVTIRKSQYETKLIRLKDRSCLEVVTMKSRIGYVGEEEKTTAGTTCGAHFHPQY